MFSSDTVSLLVNSYSDISSLDYLLVNTNPIPLLCFALKLKNCIHHCEELIEILYSWCESSEKLHLPKSDVAFSAHIYFQYEGTTAHKKYIDVQINHAHKMPPVCKDLYMRHINQ